MLEKKVVELLTQLQHGLTQYAPAAFEVLKMMVRVQAIASLVGGFMWILFVVIYLLAVVQPTFRAHAPKAIENPYQERERRYTNNQHANFYQVANQWYLRNEWEDFDIAKCLAGVFFTVIGIIVFCAVIMNVWNWVGVFDPSLAIAHQLAVKVGIMP